MLRLIIVAASLSLGGLAHAGVYSDDMARCLVSSTSSKDKTDLVRWIFANAALHPDVANVSSVSAEARDKLDRDIAALLERLVTDVCRKQSDEAFRYEGATAFQDSFGVLGQVAMQELMSNKDVANGFQTFAKYLDNAKFEALGKQ